MDIVHYESITHSEVAVEPIFYKNSLFKEGFGVKKEILPILLVALHKKLENASLSNYSNKTLQKTLVDVVSNVTKERFHIIYN